MSMSKTGKKLKSVDCDNIDLTFNEIYDVFIDSEEYEFIIDDVGDKRYVLFNNNCYEYVDVTAEASDTTNNVNTTNKKYNPLVVQQSGNHYKNGKIQPIEYSERNNLSMCQGNIVKYVTRHKEKNGVDDLAKVVHYALLEALFVYGEYGATELRDKVDSLINIGNN